MLLNQNIQLFDYQYWMSLSTKIMTANYPSVVTHGGISI